MYIPDCLVWAMDEDGCTAVKVYCEEQLREVIAARFTEVFNEEYEKIIDLIEEQQGNCYEKDEGINPFKGAQVTSYGVFLPFNALALYCGGDGDYLALYNACEALDNALKAIKREYTAISYEGYVAYWWSDVYDGDTCQYAISSKKKKDKRDVIYDFVGEALGKALEDEDTWVELSDRLDFDNNENEFKETIKLLHAYSKWIPSDAIDRVIEISKETNENITEDLQKLADTLRSGDELTSEKIRVV